MVSTSALCAKDQNSMKTTSLKQKRDRPMYDVLHSTSWVGNAAGSGHLDPTTTGRPISLDPLQW